MAEIDEELGDDLLEDEDLPRKKMSGKKLVLFILLPLLLLLGGGGVAFVLGLFDGLLGKQEVAHEDGHGEEHGEHGDGDEAAEAGPGYFLALPDMLVNLSEPGRQQRFLKISISLELNGEEDAGAVEQNLPRVVDQFQTYLRELRVDDLQGSAGLYRLRQELLRRVSVAVEPVAVRDVLFRELLVQ